MNQLHPVDDLLNILAPFLTPVLVAVVAYFLSRLVSSIDRMAIDINEIKITISAHGQKVDDMEKRVSKLEDELSKIK